MKKRDILFTEGPLMKNLLFFSLPILFSGILQLLYNAADLVVVGQFAQKGALASVGTSSSVINLLVNAFTGLSVGACIVTAKYLGARDRHKASAAAHTSIVISLITGTMVLIVGISAAGLILKKMNTPDEIFDRALLYMRIYFAGAPALTVYNFGAAIMRAMGDTRYPLKILSVSGIINVLLNLFFVIVLKLDVAGVALATIISQVFSAVMIILHLCKTPSPVRISFKKLKIDFQELKSIIKIGLPAGIQGSVFSLSNIVIQSSINLFGSVAMDGCAAAGNVEGFIYTAMNSVSQASMTFTSQNYGAKNYKRISQVFYKCGLLVSIMGIGLSGIAILLREPILSIYLKSSDAIGFAVERLIINVSLYFICGLMESFSGSIRGMGYSILPMTVSLLGACGVRLLWVFTVFQWHQSLPVLFASYPISWTVTTLTHFICFVIIKNKVIKSANNTCNIAQNAV